MKQMRLICCGLAAGIFVLLSAGCRSDAYYQDRAVSKARKFLLENAKELSTEEIYFVRFNPPLLLTGPVLGKTGAVAHPVQLESQQQQICVTWRIPGRKKCYMVFGVSGGRMAMWYPNRLIRKEFKTSDKAFDAALESARKYTKNYLFSQLTIGQYNQVRFAYPWVLKTDFPLTFNPTGTLSPKEIEENRAKVKDQRQYSLVWKFQQTPKYSLVICGTAKDDSISGWSINFAGVFETSEVDAATRAVIRTPESPDIAPEPVEKPKTVSPKTAKNGEKNTGISGK